ncbi:hypothetical protein MUNTM_01420 [Mycobacterium sp. MUNTM1]
MKIATVAVSAALLIAPLAVATPAHAGPGCTQVSGRLSICQDPSQWPLVLPEGYMGKADQDGSCGAFAVTCKPPCHMMSQLTGQLVPNPRRGVGEWCSDAGQ